MPASLPSRPSLNHPTPFNTHLEVIATDPISHMKQLGSHYGQLTQVEVFYLWDILPLAISCTLMLEVAVCVCGCHEEGGDRWREQCMEFFLVPVAGLEGRDSGVTRSDRRRARN